MDRGLLLKDNRDPAVMGQALIDLKVINPELTFSQLADGKGRTHGKTYTGLDYCDLATDSGHSSSNGLNGRNS